MNSELGNNTFTISKELLTIINTLLVSGKRQDAIALYCAIYNCDSQIAVRTLKTNSNWYIGLNKG